MDREKKAGEITEKMALFFDLLAEKGILTAEEIKERIKKLKDEIPPSFRWVQ